MRRSLARTLTAVLVLFAMLIQGSWALAGTTGSISGVLTDSAGTAVSAARVSATSPSQQATVTTDASGRYQFVSLAPDTYTLSFEKQGYQTGSQPGITVQADQNITVNLSATRTLQTIGRTASRANSALVRPGQTASEYSVTPAQQQAVASLGGGTNLNSAYSAISSVPGVVVPIGNAGWGQSVFIRGGDYTQTGNEVDGIPINRSFDQYASGALSSLGNQEVQVYTGNAPADAQAVGLAGFINQVIRTGTYPGNISASLGVGTPAVYNHANFEVAGASPNRLFSYYLGTGGYSQSFRVVDQFNGAGYLARSGFGTLYNYTAANCGTAHPTVGCYSNSSPFLGGLPLGPSGYNVADLAFGGSPYLNDRETIANFHIGLPHKKDGNHDDIQLLYDYGNIRNYPNTSMNAWGPQLADVVNGTADNGAITNLGTCPAPAAGGSGYVPGTATTCAGPVAPFYADQNVYTGPVGAPFTASGLNATRNYAFAHSPTGRVLGAPIDFNRQDGETNAFAIVKAQYQHNIADKGYIRLYGYTLYSDRIDNGMVGLFQNFAGAFPQDYTISAHTRGVVLNSGYQLSPEHLLNFNVGYTTSNADRYNNLTAATLSEQPVAYLLSSANPTGGCYAFATGAFSGGAAPAPGSAAVQVPCANAAQYRLPPVGSAGPLAPRGSISPTVGTENGYTCGGAACQYYAINDGRIASDNTVKPKFLNMSLADTWKPSAKLSIDASLRLDTFSYVMRNTNTLGNQLFVNDYNATHCVNGTTIANRARGAACAAGFSPTTLSAQSSNLTYADILQPRLGATYSLDPYNVLRASYGRFVQPAQTSAVQATSIQSGPPSAQFYSNFGFTSYARAVEPEISYNTDFSWEHQFRGSDVSSRLTPFYRKTQNEFATILVDPKTNFVATVNGQNRTASGFELAVSKGDFSRNGISAQLSYTYTYAYNKYKVFPTGGSFVTGINQAIEQFNGFTRAGGGAPCYTTGGAADPACAAGSIANPYYNVQPQGLLDPNGKYFPYNQAPGYGSGTSTSYLIPHVASLVVQYKKDRLRVTPSIQFEAGSRYGSPVAVGGIDPSSCTAALGSAATDPRYAGTGVSAGSGYDASSCAGIINVPDPYTGKFDAIGQFVQPNLINANLQLSYDFSRNMTLQVTAANIYSQCFGGSNVPWASAGRFGCGYSAALSAGNFYNPGDTIQSGFQYPYAPVYGSSLQALSQQAASPFQLFLELKLNHL